MKHYKIREYRKLKRIKATTLAEKLNITRETYYKKENQKIPFKPEELLILSEMLNTSINKLLEIVNE